MIVYLGSTDNVYFSKNGLMPITIKNDLELGDAFQMDENTFIIIDRELYTDISKIKTLHIINLMKKLKYNTIYLPKMHINLLKEEKIQKQFLTNIENVHFI